MGGCIQGCVSMLQQGGGVHPGCSPPSPVNRMTHARENITFLALLRYMVGKHREISYFNMNSKHLGVCLDTNPLPPQEMATTVVGTLPTGMDSCFH